MRMRETGMDAVSSPPWSSTEEVAPSFPAGLPPQRWDLPQLCLKSYGEQCAIVSVLNLWGRNSTTLRAQTQEQIYAAVNAPGASAATTSGGTSVSVARAVVAKAASDLRKLSCAAGITRFGQAT